MFVDIHQQSVRRGAGVAAPQVGLGELYPVKRNVRPAAAAVGQRLWIGKDAAQRSHFALFSLNVLRSAKVVGWRASPYPDRVTRTEFDRCRGHRYVTPASSWAALRSISSVVSRFFSTTNTSTAAAQRS